VRCWGEAMAGGRESAIAVSEWREGRYVTGACTLRLATWLLAFLGDAFARREVALVVRIGGGLGF
jgi:hypothetical protein